MSDTHLPPPPSILLDISAEARFSDIDGDGDSDMLVANENPAPIKLGNNSKAKSKAFHHRATESRRSAEKSFESAKEKEKRKGQ